MNGTDTVEPWNVVELVLIIVVLTLLIVACVVGNCFVLSAIILERDLRSRPQCYLIFSLALADLLVGLIVTPLKAVETSMRGKWLLGVELCDFWISIDVLLCTASIWHLVAIALDRYWSVTDICYVQNRTPRRIFAMLAIVWIVSSLISLTGLAWKDTEFEQRFQQHICLISQQITYQVISTAMAFYIPLFAIIVLYYKIMRAARLRFRRERDRRTMHMVSVSGGPRDSSSTVINGSRLETRIRDSPTPDSTSDDEHTPMQQANGDIVKSLVPIEKPPIGEDKPRLGSSVGSFSRQPPSLSQRRETVDAQRQRRAWRTLAIITGTFILCWISFFILSVYRPICMTYSHCAIPEALDMITSWLGYLNSALNPLILCSIPDFRLAFHRILKRICCCKPQY